ncbi:hypothetical protein [Streptomyces avidinii]|uniref:hypothetical protein n=1 Tax=Streptomyces avidinii TaxID=1895 RepID=UPI00386AF404
MQWLPPAGGYHCEYAAQWTATKLRWNLTADDAERQALLGVAEDCPNTRSSTNPRPDHHGPAWVVPGPEPHHKALLSER